MFTWVVSNTFSYIPNTHVDGPGYFAATKFREVGLIGSQNEWRKRNPLPKEFLLLVSVLTLP
jgi:hypothetical protein